MAQAPGGNSNSSTPPSGSTGGKGGSNGSKTNVGGSRGLSKSSAKGKSKSNTKRGSLELNANIVPAHHAHHGMSGEYTTKGKFATMPDGQNAFED